MKLTDWCAALYIWCLPHWFGWRIGWDGRLHPIPTDSYGRPRRRALADMGEKK